MRNSGCSLDTELLCSAVYVEEASMFGDQSETSRGLAPIAKPPERQQIRPWPLQIQAWILVGRAASVRLTPSHCRTALHREAWVHGSASCIVPITRRVACAESSHILLANLSLLGTR